MSNPAPGELETIRDFVNTHDLESGDDDVATPEALTAWLRGRGLLDASELSAAEHRRALAVREGFRSVLRAHHGHPDAEIEPAVLTDASQRAKLRLVFDEDGVSRLEPSAPGVDGALGRLLTIAHEADTRGEWTRLKICPADDCQWAFYDRSRNRSATWCDMKVCGNRHKVREYRERRLKAG